MTSKSKNTPNKIPTLDDDNLRKWISEKTRDDRLAMSKMIESIHYFDDRVRPMLTELFEEYEADSAYLILITSPQTARMMRKHHSYDKSSIDSLIKEIFPENKLANRNEGQNKMMTAYIQIITEIMELIIVMYEYGRHEINIDKLISFVHEYFRINKPITYKNLLLSYDEVMVADTIKLTWNQLDYDVKLVNVPQIEGTKVADELQNYFAAILGDSRKEHELCDMGQLNSFSFFDQIDTEKDKKYITSDSDESDDSEYESDSSQSSSCEEMETDSDNSDNEEDEPVKQIAKKMSACKTR